MLWTRALLTSAISLSPLASACGGSRPTGPGDQQPLALDAGTLVSPMARLAVGDPRSRMTWSADGSELYYVPPDAPDIEIVATTAASGYTDRRVLVAGLEADTWALDASSDGAWLYFVVDHGTGDSLQEQLLRVATAGSTPELMVADVDVGATGHPWEANWVLSGDGRLLAYTSATVADSTFVLDTRTGVRRGIAVASISGPVAFSPDRTRLLIQHCGKGAPDFFNCPLSVADLATGTVQALNDPLVDEARVSAEITENWLIRWTSGGIRRGVTVLRLYEERYAAIQDVDGGAQTRLGMSGYVGEDAMGFFAGLGSGGAPAAWKVGCIRGVPPSACAESRAALYVFGADGSGPKLVAVTAWLAPNPVVFSPDGRRVAYVVEGGSGFGPGLFVHDVP